MYHLLTKTQNKTSSLKTNNIQCIVCMCVVHIYSVGPWQEIRNKQETKIGAALE